MNINKNECYHLKQRATCGHELEGIPFGSFSFVKKNKN